MASKILVVDDHSVVRQGIVRILESASELDVKCDEAGNARDALKMLADNSYSVVLLDISLGDTSGLDLLEQLHRTMPKLHVFILSMYSEEQYAMRAISMGAAGYLTKESAAEELVAAVASVLAHGRYISPSLANRLADHASNQDKSNKAPHEFLSHREMQILQLIGSGKSPSKIADKLFLSVKTVSTYRTRLLSKLGLQTTPELIKYAIDNKLTE